MSRGLRSRVERLEKAAAVATPEPDGPPPHFWNWLGGLPIPADAEAGVLAFWEEGQRADLEMSGDDLAIRLLREESDRLELPPEPQIHEPDFDIFVELCKPVNTAEQFAE